MDNGLRNFLKNLKLRPVQLVHKAELSPGVFVLSFPAQGSFLPGQVVGISVDGLPPRLYSIASAPDDAHLELLFNVKPDGQLTPRLAGLKPGDTVQLSAPFGAFLGDDHPAWWIAAGTGIAPFRSMTRAGLSHNKMLIHGGRTVNSFYFENEITAALGVRYVRCCSQETGPGLYPGRLTRWLAEQPEYDSSQNYYLCGSAEMVVEVRDLLISRGVPIDRILSEIYF
ncbi:MAG: oxidoreductase [Bacteroidetes bacterium]|nr:oxidoreductase [Bacteroidota bacterium]